MRCMLISWRNMLSLMFAEVEHLILPWLKTSHWTNFSRALYESTNYSCSFVRRTLGMQTRTEEGNGQHKCYFVAKILPLRNQTNLVSCCVSFQHRQNNRFWFGIISSFLSMILFDNHRFCMPWLVNLTVIGGILSCRALILWIASSDHHSGASILSLSLRLVRTWYESRFIEIGTSLTFTFLYHKYCWVLSKFCFKLPNWIFYSDSLLLSFSVVFFNVTLPIAWFC